MSLDLVAPLVANGSSVADIVEARRILARLSSHTLATLPPRCRQAFALNRFDGLTYPEVAAVMGISVKMVEKHVSVRWLPAVGLWSELECAFLNPCAPPPAHADATRRFSLEIGVRV